METKVSDLAISRSVKPRSIQEVVKSLDGVGFDDLEPYGRLTAKLNRSTVDRLMTAPRRGKLVLVTATSPTRAGEGKTTVSIGLVQALARLGKNVLASLREPSLGPVFGMKGGATGGGLSQLIPMDEINLHFTGDMHAISSANNLISAMIDNHIHQGNKLDLDSRAILQKRVLDMNDRALRDIVIGLGGKTGGYPRESGFDITAASEVMAVLCLAQSVPDLRNRLGSIVIGRNRTGEPVRVRDLEIEDALLALLGKAYLPNLVQTLEGTPVLVHGGPFANIAHGCSSVIATRCSLSLADIVVTEGGFGADLGFEKFCDIVAGPRQDEMSPDAVVLVTTVRALKLHGGISYKELESENVEALIEGARNLKRHVSIVEGSGLPFVVAINRFSSDTDVEIAALRKFCEDNGWNVAEASPFDGGGKGVEELGEAVVDVLRKPASFSPFYNPEDSLEEKLDKLVSKVYGGIGVEYSARARKQLKWLKTQGYGNDLVCVAKTQYSLSDDPRKLCAPSGFTLKVREFQLSAGAGFVVALAGEIMRMPGLTRKPSALEFRVDDSGLITHMF